jgi:hypothetical protein
MDAADRPIRRKMVNFNEQKKFHKELAKPVFVGVKKSLLRERIINYGKKSCTQ